MQTVENIWQYTRELVYAEKGASMEAINTIMVAKDVSYLPILEHNRHKNVSLVRRKVIWKKMVESGGAVPSFDAVRENPLPEVHRKERLALAMQKLDGGSAVIVRDDDGRCDRFLSPRVVAKAFRDYAERFQVIESLEELIRRRLSVLSAEDLSSALQRQVSRPEDLTFGEYHTAFSKLWEKLDLQRLDRSVVLGLLDTARKYRNGVMHFRFEVEEAQMEAVKGVQRLLGSSFS